MQSFFYLIDFQLFSRQKNFQVPFFYSFFGIIHRKYCFADCVHIPYYCNTTTAVYVLLLYLSCFVYCSVVVTLVVCRKFRPCVSCSVFCRPFVPCPCVPSVCMSETSLLSVCFAALALPWPWAVAVGRPPGPCVERCGVLNPDFFIFFIFFQPDTCLT